MSAFGQAGFGSRNRQNQLRAQGQMDPYGNQVRQAKQAPTFNIYSQQPAPSSQPATPRQQTTSMPAYGGQPQTGGPTPTSPGVTQPSTPPAQPQTGGPFPTYDSVMGPKTGGPMPTMGQAQPIPPASAGAPYQSSTGDGGYQQRVDAAAQQWASTPAGSQQRDWAGNAARNALRRAGPGENLMDVAQSAADRLVMNGYASDAASARQSVSSALPDNMRSQFSQRMQQIDSSAEAERQRLASLPQNQPGYNPFPGGVTFADFWGPNAMQAQSWHRNYNPDGSKRIVGWGGGGIGVAPQPIYAQ